MKNTNTDQVRYPRFVFDIKTRYEAAMNQNVYGILK